MITRLPLVVKKPSLEEVAKNKQKLKEIAENFALYLSFYRSERDSKHSKMGPVGKILSRMRTGKRSEAMMGEAIRIHEMDAKKNNRPYSEMSAEQYNALKSAIFDLSIELDNVTAAAHSRVISLVDAMVYFFLEKRRKDFFFAGIEKFGAFLQTKYGSLDALAEAWKEPVIDWDTVPFPTKKLDKFKNIAIRNDVEAYLEQVNGNENAVEEAEEEVGV
jgi:hypothetical protein